MPPSSQVLGPLAKIKKEQHTSLSRCLVEVGRSILARVERVAHALYRKEGAPDGRLETRAVQAAVARLQLEPECGVALGAGLTSNRTLTSLSLRLNHIGEQGGRAIAAALESNDVLRTLDLSSNGVDMATKNYLRTIASKREGMVIKATA